MAFLLGSGPSLHGLDFDRIAPHVTIAVNSAIAKAPQSDYYFSCDFGMTVWKSWLYLQFLPCELILYNVDVGWRHLEKLTGRDTFAGIDQSRITYFDMAKSLRFTPEPPLIEGSTSAQVAAHFAHVMGCSPIVLLGCDCKYDGDKYHFYDYPGEFRDAYRKDEYRDFKPRDLIVRRRESNRYLDGHLACWQKIKDANPDIEIIDCSGGRLTMFEQMSVEEVLEKYA
jgi:hypothetical protein